MTRARARTPSHASRASRPTASAASSAGRHRARVTERRRRRRARARARSSAEPSRTAAPSTTVDAEGVDRARRAPLWKNPISSRGSGFSSPPVGRAIDRPAHIARAMAQYETTRAIVHGVSTHGARDGAIRDDARDRPWRYHTWCARWRNTRRRARSSMA